VGGAALSSKFTSTKIAPAYTSPTLYAKDAMTGLRLMNEVMDPALRQETLTRHTFTGAAAEEPAESNLAPQSERRSSKVRTGLAIPPAPYLDRKVRDIPNLGEIWSYINPFMLFGKNLGFKGNFERHLADRDDKALELFHNVEEVKTWSASFIRPKAVWQFFEAERHGNAIHLFAKGASSPLEVFSFSRQPKEDGLCLSDYLLPAEEGVRDHVALFAVTAGSGIRERAEEAKNRGEYFKSVALLALATETAEAAAEWLHRRIREDWGFPDPPSMTMQERWTSRYRGKRYSFGYGACPNMEDQVKLFALLRPEEIGIGLTEGFMMEPEASVSAVVFHHPDAAYFTAAGVAELETVSA
jgi:5-methyltetrahydrofolate--homocysteine methyltransferase